MKKSSHLLIPSILTGFFCVSLGFLGTLTDTAWEDWRPATCMTAPTGCFCENMGAGFVRQPINAASSLAFVFVGILVLSCAKQDLGCRRRRNLLATRYAYALILGSSLISIGLGSAFYHASLSFAGQTADVLGMYFFVSFMVVYNLSRICPIRESRAVLLFVVLNSVLAYFLIAHPQFRRYVFAVALVVALVLEFKVRTDRSVQFQTKYLVLALATMLLSFVVWILDTYKVLCDPGSLFQGHALWHLGGAVSAWLLYLYYRSENA